MADDRGMPGHTGEEMALRMAKNTETPEGSAPTPKQREEREIKWRFHTVWFKGHHYYIGNLADGEPGIGPFDTQADAQAALDGLRTHSPEEPVGEEGPFPANRAAGSWLHRALYRSGFGILSVRQSVDVLHLANRMSREYPEDGQPDPVGQAFDGEGES